MKCTARTKSGNQCRSFAVHGATVCDKHGGMSPQVRAKAAVRFELTQWKLGQATDDPGETLLRLLTQSRVRADMLSAELERKADKSGLPLESILVGDTYVEGSKVGEYIRGLVQLEAAERDRCANFARLAIAAGLAERQVRVAERQGEMLAALLQSLIADPALGFTAEQKAAIPNALRRHLAAVAS